MDLVRILLKLIMRNLQWYHLFAALILAPYNSILKLNPFIFVLYLMERVAHALPLSQNLIR